ncbi:hypothetical protein R6Q59_007503 [Mikania micrantha]
MERFERLKIPLEEIKLATSNFSDENLIACGGFGKVYTGKLAASGHQNTVVVKRLGRTLGHGDREFFMEIHMLSCYKHKNLISLVGYCIESGENILVFEYAKHGSLDKYLSDEKLSWLQRLKISLGAARGLNYLHNDVGHRVLHRDIKSSNILLDENWEAKISNFGLSKIDTFFMTYASGTIGYVDPQYVKTGILTKESDVYSFGVVLFEILCGKPAIIKTYQDDHCSLASLAQRYFEQNKLQEIIVSGMKNEMEMESLHVFTMVAYQCLKTNRTERPAMAWIVEKLEKALELQEYHLTEKKEHLAAMNAFELITMSKGLNLGSFFDMEQGYRLEDILSATNNFSDENLIAEGALGKVYKGQLLQSGNSMNVAIRRFDCKYGKGDELQMEISMLKSLKHKNIASVFKRFDESNEKIIIYEQSFHGPKDFKYV